MSNLATRVAVAIVGIPVVLLLTMAGGFYFFAFVALVSTLALREFYALERAKGAQPLVAAGLLLGLLVNAVFITDRVRVGVVALLHARGIAVPAPSMAQVFLIVCLAGISAMFVAELFRGKGSALQDLGATVLGVLYVGAGGGALIGIRELFVPGDFPVYLHFPTVGPDVPAEVVERIDRWGGLTVLSIFAAIWVCDSAAYFVGRSLGRHKLFPRVSPGKTWEGAVAGFVGAVGAFLLARAVAIPYLSVGSALVCGVVVGAFGQIGDLAESLLKRDAGVKDSSALIPGHGGVLDRFDSILFVAPLLYLYLDFIVF